MDLTRSSAALGIPGNPKKLETEGEKQKEPKRTQGEKARRVTNTAKCVRVTPWKVKEIELTPGEKKWEKGPRQR